MHLIYTRFWYKVMRDLGLVKGNEPVKRLLTQGMVTNRVEGTSDWKAMSKSLGNGVDPDEMIKTYGADATRMFVLFAAPAENELRWSESGIEGSVRFLRRVWGMVERWRETLDRRRATPASQPRVEEFSDGARALRRKTHQTIARVTDDFEKLDLNTNVAALMELSNALGEFNIEPSAASPGDIFAAGEAIEALVVMLAPFSPHVAEEMWESLGHEGGLVQNPGVWPLAAAELARKEELEIPVQVNGKLRDVIRVPANADNAALEAAAMASEKVQPFLAGKTIKKIIVVPQKLVNIAVA
jgi:leucyl-tRNA synthetase